MHESTWILAEVFCEDPQILPKSNIKLKNLIFILNLRFYSTYETTQKGTKSLLISARISGTENIENLANAILGCVSFNFIFHNFCGHVLRESKWILAGVILRESSCESILGFRVKFSP